MSTEERTGTRILVPLDGSASSEGALPVAERIAVATKRPLLLVRIVPITTWAFAGPNALVTPDVYQDLIDDEERAGRDYLEIHAAELRARGVSVNTWMQRGDPGLVIPELYEPFHVGLVVMTTHGRTGMARLALGSVADYLVRHSHVPVLLLRPTAEGGVACDALERAIVPLDGSPAAEAALELVELLAGVVIREVALVRVVYPSEQPSADEDAQGYLARVRRRLLVRLIEGGCPTVTVDTQVLHGEAADRIVRRAQAECDLVIMATRGETGTRRWMFGSTADRVLHDCRTPLLLIHPSRG